MFRRVLFRSFSDRYRSKTGVDKKDYKRLCTSYKTGCPFIIRITFKAGRGFWSVNDPIDELEHSHNHPCTALYNSITPHGKKELTTQQDIRTIVNMTNNDSKVTEIIKNLSRFDGNSVLSYQDVYNISDEVKQGRTPNSKIRDAQVLIDKMKENGYLVRYEESRDIDGSFIKLKNLFFIKDRMHINTKKMGQVFIRSEERRVGKECPV